MIRRFFVALFFALAAAAATHASDPVIREVQVIEGATDPLIIEGRIIFGGDETKKATALFVEVDIADKSDRVQMIVKARRDGGRGNVSKFQKNKFLITGPPATYDIDITIVDPGDAEKGIPFFFDSIEETGVIGKSDTTPDVDPDDETDDGSDDDPPPIDGEGYQVLIVHEETDDDDLPPEQAAIMASPEVRKFLNDHCERLSDGTAAWRIIDQDADMSHAASVWRKAMERDDRTELPWIYVTNGKAGFAGPLPKSVEASLELLKKYVPKG